MKKFVFAALFFLSSLPCYATTWVSGVQTSVLVPLYPFPPGYNGGVNAYVLVSPMTRFPSGNNNPAMQDALTFKDTQSGETRQAQISLVYSFNRKQYDIYFIVSTPSGITEKTFLVSRNFNDSTSLALYAGDDRITYCVQGYPLNGGCSWSINLWWRQRGKFFFGTSATASTDKAPSPLTKPFIFQTGVPATITFIQNPGPTSLRPSWPVFGNYPNYTISD